MTNSSPTTDHGADWDKRYSSEEQLFSGQPNGALVTEVATLRPGRALDVGCGEGGDAVWLAHRGWSVTALDVSRVALDRAARRAGEMASRIDFVHAGLLDADLDPGSFDLVTVHYPALPATPGREAERLLAAAVVRGGTLLVVHHADVDAEAAKAHGFDPADYVMPGDVMSVLDDDWLVEVDERRPRDVPTGGGSGHSHDLVLRARRVR
ncbi:class I SAM-dependent methyltransferase [Mycolicibacterium sediminis]|uniref:Methyltransferase domain-containing protein n=1 Tax=Mycolicibacterium sediminis TaxID=1286180 RepID=A0A7I7QRP8_9MYCO|nr:class I SAM-dependent methyltransferase [Mycolicibacterium sediminis]BBY28994.1 hypothetical protein MSEDJ_30900 [Mycolicibacterium sediminis]